jgi:xanthine/uracil/vitamin C permease (AzgA family)
MNKLRLVPTFIILLFLSYLGVSFVEANREQVIVTLGRYQSQPTTLGFVLITCFILGMLIGTFLWSIEVFTLWYRLRGLKQRVKNLESTSYSSIDATPVEEDPHKEDI